MKEKILKNISSCKSPISMHTAVIKEYFSLIKGIDKEDIITVALTPCTAKKSRERKKYYYKFCYNSK